MLMSKTEALSFSTNNLPVMKICCRHSHPPCLTNVYIIFGNRSCVSHQHRTIQSLFYNEYAMILFCVWEATAEPQWPHWIKKAHMHLRLWKLSTWRWILTLKMREGSLIFHLSVITWSPFLIYPMKESFIAWCFFFPSEVWGRLTLPGKILLPWCSVLDKQLAPNF